MPVPGKYWANAASIGPVQARYWQLMACLQGHTSACGWRRAPHPDFALLLAGHELFPVQLKALVAGEHQRAAHLEAVTVSIAIHGLKDRVALDH